MKKAIIGFPNLTKNFTFTSDGWEMGRPITNAQTLPLSNVARSLDLQEANMQLLATSTQGLQVGRIIGICRHDMTTFSGQARAIYYFETTLDTVVADTNWQDIWPTAYDVYSDNFLRPNFFSGKYSPDEIAGQVPMGLLILDEPVAFAAVEIYFRDPENPNGKISIGKIVITPGQEVSVNFEYGAQFGLRSLDNVVESEGGGIDVDQRQAKRVFSGHITYLPGDEAKIQHFERMRQLKIQGDFLWIPNADDALHLGRDAFLARHKSLDLFTYSSFGRVGVPLNLEEITDR